MAIKGTEGNGLPIQNRKWVGCRVVRYHQLTFHNVHIYILLKAQALWLMDTHGPSLVHLMDTHGPALVKLLDTHGPAPVQLLDTHGPAGYSRSRHRTYCTSTYLFFTLY